MDSKKSTGSTTGLEIAVIGLAGRFPQAGNIEAFWENLKKGVESITFLSDDEIKGFWEDAEFTKKPEFVRVKGGILEDKEYFDASFFGYSPGEAEVMDPQIRIFHECCWQALEDAGYDPESYEGQIGLYAGSTESFYWKALTLLSGKLREVGSLEAGSLTNKDFLTTKVSYKLNLTGPSVLVQTACSTSLVAVHIACRALLTGECKMALAGGVTVSQWKEAGYFRQEGAIVSGDGHCRAFDEDAGGTVFGNGAGVVVLKALKDALKDRDHIYAVVKGSAINNDGYRKVGFSAPSVKGQAEVIRAAMRFSRVEPESISYIETHGTGTALGDPIEIEGLTKAFDSEKRGFCRIGSVKTNVGHMDSAAGIAGFIKTVLALHHKLIPPSLNFKKPNPKIDFENSPFYVNTELTGWRNDSYPLRAGVSAFGIGGTNAHVVLEEWPGTHKTGETGSGADSGRPYKIVVLSARTKSALEKATGNLVNYMRQNTNHGIQLADIAYTLQVGRKGFKHRKMVVCPDIQDAVRALSCKDSKKVVTGVFYKSDNPLIFMFPGQGAQYVDMGLELYQREEVFREEMDRCFEILRPLMDDDLREVLYPGLSRPAAQNADLNRTALTQPVVFTVEYALSRLLMNWGIKPKAMIGHSIGEYVAACLSGVFSLKDALKLVVLRGKLMQRMPAGAMLSVPLSEAELAPMLNDTLSLAAVNSSNYCVVSGAGERVDVFAQQLQEKGVESRFLHTSHAFHSRMMDPVLKEFEEAVSRVVTGEPEIPYLSNVTGKWLTADEVSEPAYWTKQLRQTVRFADGLSELLKGENSLFVEVGPGRNLSTFVRQHRDKKPGQININLLRHPREEVSDTYFLLYKIGRLWLAGVKIDWQAFYSPEQRYRVSLPTYPFERQYYWIDSDSIEIEKKIRPKKDPGQQPDREPVEEETGSEELYSRPELTGRYVEAKNETQRKLVDIWQNFFRYEQIGIHDDFFELGGDSLKGIKLASRIHKEFRVKVPIAEFFNRPIIEELAEYIDMAQESLYSCVEIAEKKEYYPLSVAQHQLYVMQQVDLESTAYSMRQMAVLNQDPGKEKFEATFEKLIARHDSLRTCFILTGKEPVQIIRAAEDIKFECEYYEAGSKGNQPARDRDLANLFARFVRPFDLSKAPLLRAGLIKDRPGRHILIVDMHHIISDVTSHNILIQDFLSFSEGADLPPLALQYKDYSEWQNSAAQREVMKQQEDFWLKEFAGDIPVLNLPTDHNRPAVQSFKGSSIVFRLNREDTRALRKLAADDGATLYIILLAIFYVLLFKLSGQEDIVIGTDVAGRRHGDLENIIGDFVNTLALRNYPGREKTFKEFLKEIRTRTLDAFDNQGYPFENLVTRVLLKRDPGRNPLFDIMFAFLEVEAKRESPGDMPVEEASRSKQDQVNFEDKTAKFDLNLSGVAAGDRLSFSLEYCKDLFREKTVKDFIGNYKEIVDAVVKDPGIKLKDIPISYNLLTADTKMGQVEFRF